MAKINENVRKKYCAVTSCEYNNGTREKIRMFRYPRDKTIRAKWNESLGNDINKQMGGLICFKHFRAEDLRTSNDNKIYQLICGAIPIVDSIEKEKIKEKPEGSESSEKINENQPSSSSFPSPTHDSHDMAGMAGTVDIVDIYSEDGDGKTGKTGKTCDQCSLKESLIKMYECKIENLQKRLKKAENSANYLKAAKLKLNGTLLQQKLENSANKELIKELEDLKKNELLRTLHHGVNRFEKYSATFRRFCLSLHYHSPRAYEFVRNSFNNNLPTVKTIQTWYSKSDIRGEPSIQDESINRLKKISNDFKEKYKSDLVCSLVFDEMKIRQQVFWSIEQAKYVGLLENEDGENAFEEENNSKTHVKQVIVFILNGLNMCLEYPVAYYLIDSPDGAQRKEMLLKIIFAVTECNIRISNITFDGLSANVKMCQLLGANLNPESSSFRPFFCNPFNQDQIFIILDPCHMEKIIRNTLANKRLIYNSNGEKIEWKYIERLYDFSKESSIAMIPTHKLTKKHLQWAKNSQSVHLATQTLSNSTANTMLFLLQQNHPQFVSAGATIEFIKIIDNLFDIFNSNYSKSSSENIFKRPLYEGNARVVFDFFERTIKYLKSLKIEVESFSKNKETNTLVKTIKLTPILQSRNLTAFRGYIINMHSLKFMYMEFVTEKKIMKQIPTYYLLQDVIEMFFGKIRSRGGYNNNPNVDQFKGAYRKLLANLEISSSNKSNCRAFETIDPDLPETPFYSNIYFISSKRAIARFDDIKEKYEQQKDQILLEVARIARTNQHTICNAEITLNFSIAFSAALIENKILKSKNFYCSDCKSVFEENEKYEAISSNILQSYPCISTYKICENTERFFRLYSVKKSAKHFDFKVVYCLIFRTMNLEALFSKSSFKCDFSHKYQFIKCIVGEYISMRATKLSNQFTLESYDEIIRHQFNRLVIDKGQ